MDTKLIAPTQDITTRNKGSGLPVGKGQECFEGGHQLLDGSIKVAGQWCCGRFQIVQQFSRLIRLRKICFRNLKLCVDI